MLTHHYRTDGLLIHSTTCYGDWCPPAGVQGGSTFDWFDSVMKLESGPLPIERDCGLYCAAFAFQHESIPLVPFAFGGFHTGFALVYSAGHEMWSRVQCASVTDSSTASRACCKCNDPRQCPFKGNPWMSSPENPGASPHKPCATRSTSCSV